MDYKLTTTEQRSEIYKYGRNEKYKTKEELEDAMVKLEQDITKELSLLRLYDKSTVGWIEIENTLQLVVKIKIPKMFGENPISIYED